MAAYGFALQLHPANAQHVLHEPVAAAAFLLGTMCTLPVHRLESFQLGMLTQRSAASETQRAWTCATMAA